MHSLWRRDMEITDVDKRWLDQTEAYITNDEEHTPLSDRFNGGQKLYYWLMFYGAFLLVVLRACSCGFPSTSRASTVGCAGS